eukprot:TRINITY_DN2196_c0_g1_i1.p1 TRINITY_DN2196_c0_g1~~TRINITY_DN2196_c0_g1_i1.p1  ORF type:complete len:106 (-),score=29.06 TRINITY_DN2196_c0_g1_i1:90-407(-)
MSLTVTTTGEAVHANNKTTLVGISKVIDVDPTVEMIYDEIEIEDFVFDDDEEIFYYPCPCGDRFQITLDQIFAGEDIAQCPSCSLMLKVIYDPDDFVEESESSSE